MHKHDSGWIAHFTHTENLPASRLEGLNELFHLEKLHLIVRNGRRSRHGEVNEKKGGGRDKTRRDEAGEGELEKAFLFAGFVGLRETSLANQLKLKNYQTDRKLNR